MARYVLLTIVVFIGVVFLSLALKGFLRRISGRAPVPAESSARYKKRLKNAEEKS